MNKPGAVSIEWVPALTTYRPNDVSTDGQVIEAAAGINK